MTTELKKFTDAYATITVASYQPLILQWYSLLEIGVISAELARRQPQASRVDWSTAHTTVHGLHSVPRRPLPKLENPQTDENIPINPKDVLGNVTEPSIERQPGILSRWRKTLFGERKDEKTRTSYNIPRAIPSLINPALGYVEPDFDFRSTQALVMEKMISAVTEKVSNPAKSFEELLGKYCINLGQGKTSYGFFPPRLQEALSPIGIAHFYRQYFFNVNEGVGPIEEAFTVAPNETLEVVYESVRRQVQEEVQEFGSEVVSEVAEEQKDTDELTDKISSMIQRDASASVSANASGSIGVWQVGAESDGSFSTSTNRGRETATRNLREMTRRASERITKSYKLATRTLEEFTTTNMSRRIISNPGDKPVSYGLRRVFQQAKIKIQDLGPRLVWQLYIRNPGKNLVYPSFVHFREAEDFFPPDVPPGMEPRPRGGTETGTTTESLWYGSLNMTATFTLKIAPGPDRVVTALLIDEVKDVGGGGGKEDEEPRVHSVSDVSVSDAEANVYEFEITVSRGDSDTIRINYVFTWKPARYVIEAWETKRAQMAAELEETALQEQFEREKQLITERSKIRPRAANVLREEERYEIMNRMVNHLIARGDGPSGPTPLEIEYFHRFFDLQSLFVYVHPAWWRPSFSAADGKPYEITAESEPAPLGKSLGWIIQEDGDDRRNAFINSPWARVCIPIKPTRERDAIRWLARYIEGEIGYDENKDPLKSLLDEIESIHTKEAMPENIGPNYVTVDSSVGAPSDPAFPHKTLYPIIDEFTTVIPTDGFIYDELKVTIP